jgi:NAD+ synthase (glutamine-hydrolysing)
MKIALAQINPTVGDIEGNLTKIVSFAEQAILEQAGLVIFPELAITGYPPMDMLLKDNFVQANLEALDRLRASKLDIGIIAGFVDSNPAPGRPFFNACAYIKDGQILAKQYKTLLPTYDVFDEDRYFEPACQYSNCLCGELSFGLSICEDIWHNAPLRHTTRHRYDPIAKIAGNHPDAIINISASPFSLGKSRLREDLVRQHALKHKVPLFFVNQVGGNDELIFDGRSFVIDGKGNLIARAKAFEEELLIVDFDKSRFNSATTGRENQIIENATEEMYAALVLGTRDYLHKCGFDKAVLGLSGGVDSAVVAAIACQAMGKENVLAVAMPSAYSSAGSIEDAKTLAENLGIELAIIPIDEAMTTFDAMLKQHFSQTKPDITEENLQARIRGTLLMALSNKFKYLLLTTGNKSELAVGYCTLYGDMCGGLAVISDIPKMKVYDLANYINEKSKREVIPPSIITKAPSAELKPNQRDQDTLPPYPILDAIIQAYVEDRLEPDEIVKLGLAPEIVQDVIKRIDMNEYKRAQAAPGSNVTATAFGFGWRMPIAQKFQHGIKKSSLLPKMLC